MQKSKDSFKACFKNVNIVMYLQDKADYNTMNKYNQNFDGVYCICSRPYPDPEDEVSSTKYCGINPFCSYELSQTYQYMYNTKVSEYDLEIQHLYTADQPTTPRGRATEHLQ